MEQFETWNIKKEMWELISAETVFSLLQAEYGAVTPGLIKIYDGEEVVVGSGKRIRLFEE